jgi:hypothetical protein
MLSSLSNKGVLLPKTEQRVLATDPPAVAVPIRTSTPPLEASAHEFSGIDLVRGGEAGPSLSRDVGVAEIDAPRTFERQTLKPVSSWPSMLSWAGEPAPGMTMPPRVAFHHKPAATAA